jgi:glycosyltransferase involved in cell wall biosynthesis
MVTNLFYPLTGGSENVVYETSRRLVQRGHHVHVLTERTQAQWPYYECVEGIHIHRCHVRFGNPILRFGTGILNAARLFKRLTAGQPFDLLHFHLTIPSIGVLLCRESRQATRIASFYGPWAEEELVEKRVGGSFHPGRLKASAFRYLQRIVLQKSAKVIVLSDYSQQQLVSLLGSPSSGEFIPGGVDLARFHPAKDRQQVKSQLHLPSDTSVLLTIRRLVPRMGVEALIGAMPRILAHKPRVMLVVGGEGSLREELERQAADLGVQDRVRFTGFIPNDELPLFYQAADLFVMPTRTLEGFGLPTIESLACGTPVVGTASGSTAEILGALDRRFLIPDSTPEAIAETTLACLNSAEDEAFRIRCRHYVETRYDWERLIDSLERTYRSVHRHDNRHP